jgi:hypothetical protein
MNNHQLWIGGGLLVAAGITACSTRVNIMAETTTGSASGSSSSSSLSTAGSGASGPGGTGTGGATGSGVSSGAGAAGPGRVVSADNDIAQYASIVIVAGAGGSQKVVEGPFFVTDVYGINWVLDTVSGSDCSIPQGQHVSVLHTDEVLNSASPPQIHGIRLPVLAGQSLCLQVPAQWNGVTVTVLGFKPY